MRRPRMTRLRHYSVFGGPDGRTIASVALGQDYLLAEDRPNGRVAPYAYVLVDAPDRTKVFVPRRDADLLKALAECSPDVGDREYETLTAEVERRGLRA